MRWGMIGDSRAMLDLFSAVEKVAQFPRPALIRGERGAGKEVIARLLHDLSPRQGHPFVEVNSAALSSGLIASEIFGHEKGSFTSATGRRIGKLEEANGGTLFLDEIGNMPLELQKLLLRVIEYQRFERIGGSEKISVDVRIIAATNMDLESAIERGLFNPDFFDRIRYAEIVVPPLRERKEDIPDLARHFLERLRTEMPSIQPTTISDEALVDLAMRPWPGNVRELRASVETAAVFSQGSAIRSHDLPPRRSDGPTARGEGFEERVTGFESKLLIEALQSSPDLKAAAARLKLSYDQLRRLMKKHDLNPK